MESLQSSSPSSSNLMSRDSKSKLNSAQSKMISAAHRVEERISDEATHLVKKAKSYLSDSRNYVQENPAKSVALAAASGLALGGLISFFLSHKK